MKQVIAIVGPNGSGKDTAGEYLAKKLNLPIASISDPIKEAARKRGLPMKREILVELGNKLLEEYGEHFYEEETLKKIDKAGIVVGIRFPSIVKYFQEHTLFTLIAIDTSPEVRYKRVKAKDEKSSYEAGTLEEFIENERKENSGNNKQRVFDIMKEADYTVTNEGSPEDLYKKLDAILEEIKIAA